MGAGNYAYLCEVGHYYFDERGLDEGSPSPKGCPCGRPLFDILCHYGTNDPNECRGEYSRSEELPFLGFDTFTRLSRITNAVDRNGNPIEAYQPVTHRLKRYDVAPLRREKAVS